MTDLHFVTAKVQKKSYNSNAGLTKRFYRFCQPCIYGFVRF